MPRPGRAGLRPPLPLRIESQPFSDPAATPGLCRLGTQNPPPFITRCVPILHRVDQEIQHMLENARLLAKAA